MKIFALLLVAIIGSFFGGAAVENHAARVKADAQTRQLSALIFEVNGNAQIIAFINGLGQHHFISIGDCAAEPACVATMQRLMDQKLVGVANVQTGSDL